MGGQLRDVASEIRIQACTHLALGDT